MRILLLVSKDGDALDLALRLQQEGHEVTLAIQDRAYAKVGDGFGLRKATDWRKELPHIGKDGLIIFDQTGWGKEQDGLRKSGFSVVGSSEGGDRLEFDRKHAQEIFRKYGMKTVPSHHFTSAEETIKFVKKNKGRWVVKQNGHADKCFSYDGKLEDGSDVIDLLENYKLYSPDECVSIDLQERVTGVELAVTRYFNGTDWVGPSMMNIEHKKLFPGGLGPKTPEMGTLMWFDDNEENKLFKETVAKMKPYLRKINFRGCFDINCIVTEKGAVPLEATPRFGYPTIHLEAALIRSHWGGFLKAVADGKPYDLQWRKGWGIVVLIAVPPFPYQFVHKKYNPAGLRIRLNGKLSEQEQAHIHFSEVLQNGTGQAEDEYLIAGGSGYVMSVTGAGATVEKARAQAYGLSEKVVVPRMFYRNDIGKKFIEHDRALLKKWGYV